MNLASTELKPLQTFHMTFTIMLGGSVLIPIEQAKKLTEEWSQT